MKKYYCINCKKEISYHSVKYGSGLCRSCSCKERYKIPENNPNYRHGNNIRNKKCRDCKKIIHVQAIRCEKCEDKHHSQVMIGKPGAEWTEEMRIDMSKKMKGKLAWNKGLTAEIDNRILAGEYSPSFVHGNGRRKYPSKFTKELKHKIFQRDNFTCQKCGIYPCNDLTAHHIDYNKQNCNEDNLITLCRSCNLRVNFKRNKWIKYFLKIIRRIKHNGD
jgi:hypothetical protein